MASICTNKYLDQVWVASAVQTYHDRTSRASLTAGFGSEERSKEYEEKSLNLTLKVFNTMQSLIESNDVASAIAAMPIFSDESLRFIWHHGTPTASEVMQRVLSCLQTAFVTSAESASDDPPSAEWCEKMQSEAEKIRNWIDGDKQPLKTYNGIFFNREVGTKAWRNITVNASGWCPDSELAESNVDTMIALIETAITILDTLIFELDTFDPPKGEEKRVYAEIIHLVGIKPACECHADGLDVTGLLPHRLEA